MHASALHTHATPQPKVLVVDDEPAVLKFVERVLRDAGYATAGATGGEQAIAMWEASGPFALLVTDVVMPQMTGDELARRIRLRSPDLKVLYLTGYSDRLFASKNTMWEDEAFLDKPPSVLGLLEAVSLILFGRLVPETIDRHSLLRRVQSAMQRDKAANW